MNYADAKAFLSRVVAWPIDKIGYVNLHYSMAASRGGKDIVTGKPYQDVDDLLSFCNWAENTNTIKELWYCTSLQANCKLNTKGKSVALRLKENAIKLKAIWVDIDVKDDPRTYQTVAEAFAAISKFRKDNGLPNFSAVVKSGGGLHIYWISDKPLDPQVWQGYAEGLKQRLLKDGIKCDAGLTTDSARILRIPGTLNHKYSPPRPVELLALKDDYDFEQDLAMLKVAVAPSVTVAVNPALTGTPIIAFDPNDTLDAGMNEPRLLDPKPILSKCQFLRDAFMSGGKDYDNPLWNLTLLCSTFLENGNAMAHEMSRGHPTYKKEETQAQYERKLDERKRGLGYPSCATIRSNGCTACDSCPLYVKGKSPLNVRPVEKAAFLAPTLSRPTDLNLPDGYFVNTHDKNTIYYREEREPNSRGEPQEPRLIKLFYSRLTRPRAQSEPSGLYMMTSLDQNNIQQVFIAQTDFGSMEIVRALNKAKIKCVPRNSRYLADFFMAWMDRLHEAEASITAQPFGWEGPGGQHTGFSFGGTSYHTDGTQTMAGLPDSQMATWYRPIGELQPWIDCCKMITDMGRPELQCIVAMAFAAPLATMGGEYSGMLSAWSSKSGSQKSTALKIGAAVWGDHRTTKEVSKSTSVSVLLKMGKLKSLPVYWDEISDETVQGHVIKVMYTASDGVEGGRGTSQITQQARGSWTLAMCTCANLSFVDYIVRKNPTTPAGLMRVLEYEVVKVAPDAKGMMDSTDASLMVQKLEGNYGMMGQKYAEYLALNYERVKAECAATIKQVGNELKCEQGERYWKTLVGCILQGAKYGNELGATFDLALMKEFLYKVLLKNRGRAAKEGLEGGTEANTDNLLTAYLKYRHDAMIWTEKYPAGAGRKKPLNVLKGPAEWSGDARQAVQVRWDVEDKMLRISKTDLAAWLQRQNIGISALMRGLEDVYHCTETRMVLAGGTMWKSLQEYVINIPVTEPGPLWDMLNQHNKVDAPEAGAA